MFAIFGLAGIFAAQRELVIAFFIYNAAHMVFAFNYFVDVLTDLKIRFAGESQGQNLNPYESTAAVFLFVNFVLSILAVFFAVKAVQEIKSKQREEYSRISVLPDSLNFELESR